MKPKDLAELALSAGCILGVCATIMAVMDGASTTFTLIYGAACAFFGATVALEYGLQEK